MLLKTRVMFRTLLSLSIAVVSFAAQVSPAPSIAQAQSGGAELPTFRSSTTLVNIDVEVTDRDGKPVTGLTKDDFAVLDHGAPQKIAIFAARGGEATEVEPALVEVSQALFPGEY